MLEMSGMITNQNYNVLIDIDAIESFISSAVLKRIKLKEFEHDEFKYIEMVEGAKKKVGGRVTGCSLKMGDFVTKIDLYVTILGSYGIVIGMDWLESHDVILNYETKWLSLTDDLGQSRVSLGRNKGVSLRFISSLQLRKSMHKG
jgi:hypothetical protein